MKRNKLIYYGILIVTASVLLWLGAELLSRVKDVILGIGIIGIALIVVGVLVDVFKNRKAADQVETPPPS